MTDPTRSDPVDPTTDVAPDPDDLAVAEGAAAQEAVDEAERAAGGGATGIVDVSAPAPEDFEDREAEERAEREDRQLEEAAAALAASAGAAGAMGASGGASAGAPSRSRGIGLPERLRGRNAGAASAAGAAGAAGAGTAAGAAAARPETLPYVDDRFSKLWVAAIVAVFALIFLNALLLGSGGLLTATPSPSPSPSLTASPSPSASPSGSPSGSPTTSPAVTSPTTSPAASPGGASPSPS